MSRPRKERENTALVVTLAIAFFGGLAALGYTNGVFARLGAELTIGLALFAAAFGVLTVRLDPGVRALAKRLFGTRDTVAKARGDRAATT